MSAGMRFFKKLKLYTQKNVKRSELTRKSSHMQSNKDQKKRHKKYIAIKINANNELPMLKITN